MLGTAVDSTSTTNTNAASNTSTIKRNLFGIRLNHDQLKDDLKEMWKEQVERQKLKWNFDFETLKPLADSTNTKNTSAQQAGFKWAKVKTSITDVAANGQENATVASNNSTNSARKHLNFGAKPGKQQQQQQQIKPRSEYTQAAFDRRELQLARQSPKKQKNFEIFNDFKQASLIRMHDHENDSDEEEEEDDALAVPQFYKYQRRMKLNEDQNRANYMNLVHLQQQQQQQQRLSVSPVNNRAKNVSQSPINPQKTAATFEPIFKFALSSSAAKKSDFTPTKEAKIVIKAKKTSPAKSSSSVRRPRPVKSAAGRVASLAMSPSTQNLIITFSENRKDTLRSAQQPKRSKQPPKQQKQAAQFKASAQSAFSAPAAKPAKTGDDKMKQQSLLDLFKQRKRRNSQQQECTATTSAKTQNPVAPHFLRSAASALHSN